MTRTNFYQRKVVGLYLIQHRETLRSYCGQSRDVLSRWKSHCSGGKKAVGIAAALREEGVDSFIFRVLEECSVSQLNEREVFWIQHYDCVEPNGYNRNSGGGAPTYVSEKTREKMRDAGKGKNKGKTASPETKEKMSAALKGRTLPPEHREKISASQKGNKNAEFKGVPKSPERLAASVEGSPHAPRLPVFGPISATTAHRLETKAKRSETVLRTKAALKAARAEASLTDHTQKLLDSLRHDSTWTTMAEDVKPPAGPSSPSLAELDALLKEWEGL